MGDDALDYVPNTRVRAFFRAARCICWDRRLPAGQPLRASASMIANASGATVCRLEAGGPRDGSRRLFTAPVH